MSYSIRGFPWRTFEPKKEAEMKQGFTLLELIVVIVILGIMATLAATQYTKMVEKSRGAEARIMIGSIRTNEAASRLQNGSCTTVGMSEFPSVCSATHYFTYALTGASGNSFTAVAARCTSGGKGGAQTTTGTVVLTTNFDNGFDSWSATAPY